MEENFPVGKPLPPVLCAKAVGGLCTSCYVFVPHNTATKSVRFRFANELLYSFSANDRKLWTLCLADEYNTDCGNFI